MSDVAQEKKFYINGVHCVHYLITAFFCICFPLLPAPEPLTATGMCLLGVLIGAVYGWSTIGCIWPSIIALFGVALVFGIYQMASMSFGNFMIMLLVLTLPAMTVMTSTGTMDYLANKALTNKVTLGKPWLTIAAILFSAMILAVLNGLVVLLLYIQFIRTLAKNVGIKPYSKLITFLYIGLALATSLGQTLLPFMGQGLTLLVTYANIAGEQAMNFGLYMAIFFPASICVVLVFLACMRFIFRVDVSPLANLTPEMLGDSDKMTHDQKVTLIVFVLWVCMMIFTSLDVFGPLYTIFSKIGLLGVSMLLVIALMLIKKEDRTGSLLDFRKGARETSWDAIFLTAVIMVLSSAISDPSTGVTAAMSVVLAPFNALPPVLFIIIMLLLGGIVTNVANNIVVAVVIMPFIYNYSVMNGIDPSGYMTLLFLLTNLAIATPGASAGAGLCFANTDLTDTRQMIKYAAAVVPILLVTAIAVGVLMSSIFG